ncbi:MAG TPA: FAD-dependent oxidoreductase, partial [Nitrospirota bacterium]
MARIIVLGGSFGGLTAAFELKRLLGRKADVTLVSEDDRFVFLPSLPWLIMGWRKPRDITLKAAEILKPKGIDFIHDAARQIDASASTVTTSAGKVLPYEFLVIATGPYLAFDEIPGLGPDKGYTACTFTLDHAVKTGATWRSVLENPGPVVVGSSQMVSCFGPSYELAFEMDAELRRRKMRHKVPIIYLTSEPYLGHMGVGGLGNSKRFFEHEFAERDIKPVVSQAIQEVAPGEIRLKDGNKIPFKLAMIAPPFKGVPAVTPLGNPRGFIPVDKNYRHTKHKNIFAIGVAVAIAPPEATPVPTGVPKTGFMTVKMAKVAAATIASDVTGAAQPHADELGVVCLMDMGNTAAIMKAYPVLPPRQSSYTKKAVWAKWMKVRFEK